MPARSLGGGPVDTGQSQAADAIGEQHDQSQQYLFPVINITMKKRIIQEAFKHRKISWPPIRAAVHQAMPALLRLSIFDCRIDTTQRYQKVTRFPNCIKLS
jgi:hypothetical protein